MDQNKHNRQTSAYPLSLLAACLLLTACGGSSDNNNASPPPATTRSLTVTPSLGQINNANVILKQLSTGAVLGTLNTGTSGTVTFSNIANTRDALSIEVQPTSNSIYFDEATATTAPFTNSLHALASVSGNSNIGVTAWTEAAYQRALALANGATPSNAQITQATTELSALAGLNILTAPTLVDSSQDLSNLTGNVADAYALSLAALAEQAQSTLGSTATTPALQLALALAADAVDGKIDGKGTAGATIGNLPYDASRFTEDFKVQINTLITTLNLPTGTNGIGGFIQPQTPTVTPPPTGTGLTLSGSETGTFNPATSSTAVESGETVYRFATANNAASISVYVKADGSVRLANFIDSNSAYECFEATCTGIRVASGNVSFSNVTLANGLIINGSLAAAAIVPPVTPPTTSNVISASGSLTTSLANLPNFSPDPTGFNLALDGSTPATASTFSFSKGNSTIKVEVDLRGSIRSVALYSGGQNLICTADASTLQLPNCDGVTLTRGTDGKRPVTIQFNNTSLKSYPSGSATTTLNGSLTGDMTSAAAWTPSELPITTDGLISMNGINYAVDTSNYNELDVGTAVLQQLSLTTTLGQFVFTQYKNQTTPVSASLTLADASLPITERVYNCALNCGVLNISAGMVSINLNDVVFKNLAGNDSVTLKNTVAVARTTGTLTTDSTSLGNFSPTHSSITAENSTLNLSFDVLGSAAQSGLSLLTVTLDPKTGIVSEVSVSGGIGSSVYKCFNVTNTLGIPACTGISVDANHRKVTFTNAKVSGGAALAAPVTVTLNGSVTATGR